MEVLANKLPTGTDSGHAYQDSPRTAPRFSERLAVG